MSTHATGAVPTRRTCSYLLDSDELCRRPALWRPANLPMAKDEWYCRQHAVEIADRVGTYGIYQQDGPVFELS